MGMSSIVKGEDRKMELWISGQSDIYRWQLGNLDIYWWAGDIFTRSCIPYKAFDVYEDFEQLMMIKS